MFVTSHRTERASMKKASIIGFDLAKRSLQAHGALADGSVAFRKKLTREKVLGFFAEQPRCIVAMVACGSAHHWGRAIRDAGMKFA
jgi:transposase